MQSFQLEEVCDNFCVDSSAQILFSATASGLSMWNISTGDKVRDLPVAQCKALCISPDDDYLYCSVSGEVWEYNVMTGAKNSNTDQTDSFEISAKTIKSY